MTEHNRQNLVAKQSEREASYDEASRARYERRAAQIAGSGIGGTQVGLKALFISMLAVFALIAARLVYLQVYMHDEYAQAAQAQRTNAITLTAKRGTIYDRNGNVLAISVDCNMVICNTTQLHNPAKAASILAKHLGGTSSDYMPKLLSLTTFTEIDSKVDTSIAEALIQELAEEEITGFALLDDTKRTYPYGDVGGQILGVLDKDGNALSGLELMYDDVLAGEDGLMIMERGLGGTPIAGGTYKVEEPSNGTDIIITLDIDLQRKLEEVLSQGMLTYEAKSATGCISDPKTGEIYAACTSPLPTITNRMTLNGSDLNLGLVSTAVEPGSIFKTITAAIGIENGDFTSDSVYYVDEATKVGDSYVYDVDGREGAMYMSVREILRRSSNAGAALLAQDHIGPKAFAEGVKRFGFGELTNIDFPGEIAGDVKAYANYTGASAGSMSFGQELAIPMIQIVRAYAALANNGVATTPHFLLYKGEERIQWPTGDKLVSDRTVQELTSMLRTVVQDGTAIGAQIEGYDIVGKTGTAEQAGETGYSQLDLVSSFCGFANALDPDVVIYVGLNHTSYHSDAAVELFHSIMEEAITNFAIVPASEEIYG